VHLHHHLHHCIWSGPDHTHSIAYHPRSIHLASNLSQVNFKIILSRCRAPPSPPEHTHSIAYHPRSVHLGSSPSRVNFEIILAFPKIMGEARINKYPSPYTLPRDGVKGDQKGHHIIINMLIPIKQNSFTHRRVLLVLNDRGISASSNGVT
jgi:hypothetical protein